MSHSMLLSVTEALERLLKDIHPLQTEQVSLPDAYGRVLAQNISAAMDLPPFSNSSMDGFAVRAEDVKDASSQKPIELNVIGDIAAGKSDDIRVGKNQAVRIMTGGVLPIGADAVIPVEYTDKPGALVAMKLEERVQVLVEVSVGEFIRLHGQDVRKGSPVLSKGHRLRPQDIGMLAALGISSLSVYRNPRVAVISTGDELIDIGDHLPPGYIYDSNGYALEAAVKSLGAIPLRIGIVPDDAEELDMAFTRCVQAGVDLIISSAGVSMGAYDFVRPVVEKHGHLEFWKVNIRPGKPILMGSYQGIPIMGLPGNPVSALVTFEIFVKPFINCLEGGDAVGRIKLNATLQHPIESDGRESFLRARATQADGEFEVSLVGSQDFGVLSSLVEANALIRIPAGKKSCSKGEPVEIWILRQDGNL